MNKITFLILVSVILYINSNQVAHSCVADGPNFTCVSKGDVIMKIGGPWSVTCDGKTYTGITGAYSDATVTCGTIVTGATSGACSSDVDDESQTIPVVQTKIGECILGIWFPQSKDSTLFITCKGKKEGAQGCGPTWPPCGGEVIALQKKTSPAFSSHINSEDFSKMARSVCLKTKQFLLHTAFIVRMMPANV